MASSDSLLDNNGYDGNSNLTDNEKEVIYRKRVRDNGGKSQSSGYNYTDGNVTSDEKDWLSGYSKSDDIMKW